MDTSVKNFDVIVVGAGPSGLSAAKVLADNGINTLVIERTLSSSRSFYGGIVSEERIKEIFSNFCDSSGKVLAPFERVVDQYRAYILDETSFTSYNVQNDGQHCYIVLREPFNNWLVHEVENSGAMVLKGVTVTELILEDGKVVGVKTKNEKYFAKVVVIAEGSKATLVKKSGLRTGELSSRETFIFAEETLQLSPKVIEERFNLLPFNGVAVKLFTQGMFNIPSIGYIYTNHSSIVIGVGILFSKSVESGLNISNALDRLKEHPSLRPLISGGLTNHYSSYILPVSSVQNKTTSELKLFSDGCILTGGCASLVDLFSWDWSLIGFLSGRTAANTVLEAYKRNDFSKSTLSLYRENLEKEVFPQMLNSGLIHGTDEFKLQVMNNLSSFILERK